MKLEKTLKFKGSKIYYSKVQYNIQDYLITILTLCVVGKNHVKNYNYYCLNRTPLIKLPALIELNLDAEVKARIQSGLATLSKNVNLEMEDGEEFFWKQIGHTV